MLARLPENVCCPGCSSDAVDKAAALHALEQEQQLRQFNEIRAKFPHRTRDRLTSEHINPTDQHYIGNFTKDSSVKINKNQSECPEGSISSESRLGMDSTVTRRTVSWNFVHAILIKYSCCMSCHVTSCHVTSRWLRDSVETFEPDPSGT